MRVHNITFDLNDKDKVKIYDENGKKVFDGVASGCFLMKDGYNQREVADRRKEGDTYIFTLKPKAEGNKWA